MSRIARPTPTPLSRRRVSPKLAPARRDSSARRGGFTLLEVMIAMAVTLLMMLALAQIFRVIGESMKQGRAALELNNRLQGVAHRIRNDLDHLTTAARPPADPATAMGYLKIYDGSLTDYSTAVEDQQHSRYGDVDDIFMGTASAGNTWFTGKVPLFVLKGAAPTAPADYAMVTIAAQHAEIIAFVQPVVSSGPNGENPNRDPNYYLLTSPNGAVAYQDIDSFADYPDAFRLHYRTLLIRPDLNVNGVLPNQVAAGNSWLVAMPHTNPALPTPLCEDRKSVV